MSDRTFEQCANDQVGNFYLQFAHASEQEMVALLVRAMWAINRKYTEDHFFIQQNDDNFMLWHDEDDDEIFFDFKDYENEIEALKAVLQQVYDERT